MNRERMESWVKVTKPLIAALAAKVDAPSFPGPDADQDEIERWVIDVAKRVGNAIPSWKRITDDVALDLRLVLVTNNIEARDAVGTMSHVWFVRMVHKQGDGTFLAFSESDVKIHGLTHYCELPVLHPNRSV